MAQFPIHAIPTSAQALDLGSAKVYHLPNWENLSQPERLSVIRQLAMQRGRDPRIAQLATRIIRKSSAKPREYKKQAAALLKWIQNPKNVYYINEPGERLQDPIYTIRKKYGDCFAAGTLLLRDDLKLVPVEEIKAGDKIWGKDRWAIVQRQWTKGCLPVTEVELNNGSSFCITEDHKVYVHACSGPKKGERGPSGRKAKQDHGITCSAKSSNSWGRCKKKFGSKIVRIPVSELKEGMELLQPESIERQTEAQIDTEKSWFIGAYIAEGWGEDSRVMLSGQDGNWKAATKHRAKALAEKLGWNTYWHRKYIAVNDREAVRLVKGCGHGALKKNIPEKVLRQAELLQLDEGLQLDASRSTHGDGWTFSTVNPKLALQYRVLQRMLGRSTSMKSIVDHGGFGSNPIHRVGVRAGRKPLKVKSIHRQVRETEVFDISTDDHYVYLPEADVTVSNCDDMAALLCALFESVGLPWKLVLSGRGPQGKMRYIEGEPVPHGVQWSHIYCMVGDQPFRPSTWYFAEPTVNGVPLGWDVISGDHRYLPEMTKPRQGPPRIGAAPRKVGMRPNRSKLPPLKHQSPVYDLAYGSTSALVSGSVGASIAEMEMQGKDAKIDWTKLGIAVVTGVLVSVGTSMVLDWMKGKGIWEGKGDVFTRVVHKPADRLVQTSLFVAPTMRKK